MQMHPHTREYSDRDSTEPRVMLLTSIIIIIKLVIIVTSWHDPVMYRARGGHKY